MKQKKIEKESIVYCCHRKGKITIILDRKAMILLEGLLETDGNSISMDIEEVSRPFESFFLPSQHVEQVSKLVNHEIAIFIHGEQNPWQKYNPKILDMIENYWIKMCREENNTKRFEIAKRDFYRFTGELNAVKHIAEHLVVNYQNPDRFNLLN
ncbi:MAG: hypothetical protein ACD_80C00057G0002 [uncultured bacterium (gcode 4)]|uniref:Uncharacterized protein n=1 Tax=uncultured bacterium (gcode 4) TaxID=1234023 RepID=K1YJ57_9BACT|nr:MAG: hypothetical protein ACD_80C00057G0002 [uncultured bacterium (gcode 4)]